MKQSKLRQRRSVSITDFDETLTEQSHASRCQISNILNKYRKTGMLTHVNSMQASYADYPSKMEFQEMQNAIANAKSMFETIPSHIRQEFKNDPGVFLDYINNPENREEMLELGFSDAHLPPVEQKPSEETATAPDAKKTAASPPPEKSSGEET